MLLAAALAVFILASLALIYTFVGYQVLATFAARLLHHQHPPPPTAHDRHPYPRLSIVICVRNESNRMASRIENLLLCDYPTRPEIIVVCDGCTDDTPAVARAAGASLVIERGTSCGKAACLNAGATSASYDLLVFTDARQRFDSQALKQLARPFTDPEVGAVGGALEIEGAGSRSVGKALDHYWTTEKMLRLAESQIDSTVGCTGAIYAIRRRLFRTIPEDTILDDVLIPMQVALQGYRVVFRPEAVAYDPQPLGGEREKARKQRTLAGNFQLLFRYPSWLSPLRNRLALQLVSHKYARIATPPLILLVLASNAVLAPTSYLATFVFVSTLALIATGCAGLAFPELSQRSRVAFLTSSFVFLQLTVCRSFFYYLNWRSARRTAWR